MEPGGQGARPDIHPCQRCGEVKGRVTRGRGAKLGSEQVRTYSAGLGGLVTKLPVVYNGSDLAFNLNIIAAPNLGASPDVGNRPQDTPEVKWPRDVVLGAPRRRAAGGKSEESRPGGEEPSLSLRDFALGIGVSTCRDVQL
jgi:hypothetical protein